MQEFLLENEPNIRVILFFSTILVVAFFEYKRPRRKLFISKAKRWANNFLLVFFNSFLIKFIFPIAAFGVALFIEEKNFGILNLFELSLVEKSVLAIVLLDLIIYWQHRLFHKLDIFWKFHKVHHSDMDFDLTTAIRFHPIEIIFSMLIKVFFIALLGTPAISVLIFEVILSSCAIFNHSNINLPKKADKILRIFIVTPDFHRVHHSIFNNELNSNYGFSTSLWDRIFNSYVANPKVAHDKMTIGLKDLQEEKKTVSIIELLKLPFTHKSYNIKKETND